MNLIGGTGALGIVMLACTLLLMAVSGLPAWIVLLATSVLFALGGMAAGLFSLPLFFSLPSRLLGLLEHDLLQALPLFVLIGAMLTHLPLAQILFRVGCHALRRSHAAPWLSALGLACLLAPMNGSVGASVAMLARCLWPRLAAAPKRQGAALICAAGTIGVIVPPSLVLILFGDAMMRAHTEAMSGSTSGVRIINTQDIFHGALLPAALLLALFAGWTWWRYRADSLALAACRTDGVETGPPTRAEKRMAAGAVLLILGLLAAVAMGYLYAVEAAATGALAVVLYGVLSRSLSWQRLHAIVQDAMHTSGALFALLIAATTATLVLRAFETDLWISHFLQQHASNGTQALLWVMVLLCLSALVLDAFEMIFVIIPLVMPPLLAMSNDPVWAGVLVLLILQAGFLLPPFGYALLITASVLPRPLPSGQLARAVLPWLVLQVLVILAVFCLPQLVWHGQMGAGA